MLSKAIDWAYFKLRYAIWGPNVSFVDGTYIPEGRPPEDRVKQPFEISPEVAESLQVRTLDFGDPETRAAFYDQLKELDPTSK